MKQNKKAYNTAAVLLLAAAVLVTISIMGLKQELVVRRYALTTPKLTQALRLVLITDLHSCSYGPGQSQLLEAIAAQQPDAVLFAGDIIDEDLPEENAFAVLEWTGQHYPAYYVSGNHEYRSGELDRLKEKIAGLGITVLAGESIQTPLGEQTIAIAGVDDPEAGEEGWTAQLKQAAQNLDQNRFSILLSHRPERISAYEKLGFDLIVSGHAHGGQWRVPGLINGLLAPNQGLFPKYTGGLYQLKNTTMVVSRGLARESTRVPRLFNPPELVVVELKPGNNAEKGVTQ